MEKLETISEGQANQLKIYERPAIKHHLVGAASSLLVGSVKKTVSTEGNSMKEEWKEEEITETFTWEL